MTTYSVVGRESFVLTPENWDTILDAIANGYSLAAAAATVGATRQAIHDHGRVNPQFAQAVRDAVEVGSDMYEDAMREKALQPQGFLANMATLKARRPERWRDTAPTTNGPTVNITINAPSPHELRAIIEGDFRVLAPQPTPNTTAPDEAGDLPGAGFLPGLDSSIAKPPEKRAPPGPAGGAVPSTSGQGSD